MRARASILIALAALALMWTREAAAMERFPPPDFESGYEMPETTRPAARSTLEEYVDVAALLAALCVATYLALVRRSRRGMFVLMLISLAYFGFWRKGCVCPIGAIQNVALALFDEGYAVPLVVILFFVAPLAFATLFGRTFCAGACPLGAIQDVFLVRPVRVPVWVESALGLFAYAYLGIAVLMASSGSAFLICRYDPFVSLFRLSGNVTGLVLGACLLGIGAFVGRPYCRFLCPYGALLRQVSSFSKWHVRISPDECVRCRLCEDACPFGAIRGPNDEQTPPPRKEGVRRLGALFLATPVLVAFGAWVGGALAPPLWELDYTVRLAARVELEQGGQVEGTTDESEAFRKTGRPFSGLLEDARRQRGRIETGSRVFGAWMGLVVALALIRLSLWRTRASYEPDRASCVSCGRCFLNCPRERLRLRKADAAPEAPAGVGERAVPGED